MTYRISSPTRGDVVVFTPGIGPEKRYLIKRLMGLPGDTVKIENGYVYIATKKNPENFIQLDESEYLEEKY
jgi:signal peptidase I